MSTAIDWLKTIANMASEEFDTYMDIEGIDCSCSEPHSGTRTILGYPVTDEMWVDGNLLSRQGGNVIFDFDTYFDMDTGNLNAIFRSSGTSGGSGTNTTNGNQFTWWPTGAGNTISNPSTASPTVTQTLYRRSTHDENGDAKQFTKEQEQMWRDLASIATMTSSYIWKTAEEIYRDAEDYQKRMRTTGVYIALSTVETSLAVLVVNGMVEVKNA